MWLFLGIAAVVAVACALKARAAAGPSNVPTGTGAVPADSGQSTPAADTDVTVGMLASTVNTVLHTSGSTVAAPLVAQFQGAVGLSPTGVYDTATSRALAAYVTNPPAPDDAST